MNVNLRKKIQTRLNSFLDNFQDSELPTLFIFVDNALFLRAKHPASQGDAPNDSESYEYELSVLRSIRDLFSCCSPDYSIENMIQMGIDNDSSPTLSLELDMAERA